MSQERFHCLNYSLRRVTALVSIALVASDAHAQRQAAAPRLDQQLAALRVIDPAMIDTSVRACGDFFQFANGVYVFDVHFILL